MSIRYNLIETTIHVSRIVDNYRRLRAAAPLIPVLKADAYGHGLAQVAAALAAEGADYLAVGSVGEAVDLREAGFAGRILALLGCQDAQEASICGEKAVIPLIAHREQLETLATARSRSDAPFSLAVKFDTGMGRLGFAVDAAEEVAGVIRRSPRLHPVLACSHLAAADDPGEAAFTREQGRRFQQALDGLRAGGVHGVQASLVNSAGLLAYPDLQHDLARPGITLYGGNPFHGTSQSDLAGSFLQAMDVTAPVLQVHGLARGETISYGRTFKAPREMRVAIIGAGYADCWSRGLSSADGRGASVLLGAGRAPVVGRVCMQMTAVDVTDVPGIEPGHKAFLLGGEGPNAIRAEELADQWATIPYEVFCVLGLNPRNHV